MRFDTGRSGTVGGALHFHRVWVLSVVAILLIAGGALVRPDDASADGASQFSGTVVDASGNPIAGDTVVLTDSSGNNYTVSTASDGTYSIIVPSGSYQFILSNDGATPGSHTSPISNPPLNLYELQMSGALDLTSSQTGLTLTVPLEPVSVPVQDGSGTPLSGVPVSASYNSGVGFNKSGNYNFMETNTCPAVTLAPGITTSVGFSFIGSAQTDATGTGTFDLMSCGSASASFSVDDPSYNAPSGEESSITGPTTLPAFTLFETGSTVTFSGVVTDAQGNPLPNVTVDLHNPVVGRFGTDVSATTDDNGNFSIVFPPSITSAQLTISGTNPDGSGTYSITSTLTLTTDLINQVLVVPLAPLAMKVTDGSGTPIVGAQVSPIAPNQYTPGCPLGWSGDVLPGVPATGTDTIGAVLTTDATGTVTYDALSPTGSCQFFIQPAAGSTAPEEYVTGPNGVWSPTQPFNVVDAVLSQFSGTVVDASGNPIAGDTVVLTDSSGNNYTVSTASDGTYSIIVPSGSYQFILSNDGATPGSHTSPISNPPLNLYELQMSGALDLTSSQTGLTLTVPLEPVSVPVQDGSGTPLSGVPVSASYNSGVGFNKSGNYNFMETNTCPAVTLAPGITTSVGFSFIGSAQTDATGTGTFDLMSCGSASASFSVDDPSYNAPSGEESSITGPTTLPAFTLFETGSTVTFSGVVTDAQGNPLPNVTVDLHNPVVGRFGTDVSATTDDNGNFSIVFPPSITSAQLTISGTNPDGSGTYSITSTLTLTTDLINQVLVVPLAPLAMKVTDGSGTPIVGAQVSPIAPNQYTPGCPLGWSGDVLPGVPATGTDTIGAVLTTDATGTVTYDALSPTGSCQFFIQPAAGSTAPEEYVTGPNGVWSPTQPFNVVDAVLSQFSGTVVDASGNPIAGDTVVLTDSSGNNYTVSTASDGTYSIIVPSGSYQFILSNDGATPGSHTSPISNPPLNLYELQMSGALDLTSSQTGLTLTVPLEPVSVPVQDGSGTPLSGVPVSASYNSGVGFNKSGNYNFMETNTCPAVTLAPGITTSVGFSFIGSAQTDATGTGTFDLMSCGSASASFSVDDPSYNAPSGEESSITGPTTLPAFTLFETGSTVTFSGVVTDAQGNPLPNVTVDLHNPVVGRFGTDVSATTDDNGNFSIVFPPSITSAQLTISGTNPDGSGTYSITSTLTLTTDLINQVLVVPLAPLAMKVTDGSGTPIVGAQVSPIAPNQYTPGCPLGWSGDVLPGVPATGTDTIGAVLTTDATGTVTYDALSPTGSCQFFIQPAAGSTAAEEYVTGPNGVWSPTQPFNVIDATLYGTVSDAGGQALSGQTVSILSGNGNSVAQTTTGSNGGFAVDAPPGTYAVALAGSVGDPTTYEATVQNIDLTLGQEIDFMLPTTQVTLTVNGPSGPVTGATVTLPCTGTSFPLIGGTASGQECASETTDSSGTAVLELLPSASITVSVVPPSGAGLQTESTTFTPSNGLVVPVSLPSASLTLTPTPTISGTAATGKTLTAVPGTWDPDVSLSYQWERNGVAIMGATGSTYALTSADYGQSISVAVTGALAGYTSATETSTGVTPVAGTLSPAPTPTISGTPATGQTLHAVPGTWQSGVTLSYQWLRNGVAITGATSSTFVVKSNDVGQSIAVAATGSLAGYNSATKTSSPLTILGILSPTPTPTISGKAATGQTLTTVPGTWQSGVTLSYQWLRNGTTITGATSKTYLVTVADDGQRLTVAVTGALAGYTSATKNSSTVIPVAGTISPTPRPTISGTAATGQILTAVPGTWQSGVTLNYQWHRNGLAIPGATTATFLVTTADDGQKLTVAVTGSLSGYNSASENSAAITPVAGVLSPSPTPTISGKAATGQTLTTVPGTWQSGVTLSYQWLRNGTTVTGATSATFLVVAPDVGQKLTVAVTGSLAGYASATKNSATVIPVAGTISPTPTPTISGTAATGQILTAVPGTWQSGVTLNYQWQRNGITIRGATSKTYLVSTADVGQKLTVAVTGSLSGYVSVSETSAAVSPS